MIKMWKHIKQSSSWTFTVLSILFTFIPEKYFEILPLKLHISVERNILINRIFTFVVIFIVIFIVYCIRMKKRKGIVIKGKNYKIIVQYGDLLEMNNCKKLISFDECFTTDVGDAPGQIKRGSICGQYLTSNPSVAQNISNLITESGLKPAKEKSKFESKQKYESGSIVPNGDYLLMSFAKLNQYGKGELTREEYWNSLGLMWREIDKYYSYKDVCIPILGSGITRVSQDEYSQQQLLDLMIESYKLSAYKVKAKNKLYIICKEADGFDLNNIGETL